MKKRLIAFVLFLALMISMVGVLAACGITSTESADLMQGVSANEVNGI